MSEGSIGDESAVLLRQYIQQALVAKATPGGSPQLYDQLVAELRKLRGAVRPAPVPGGGPPPVGAPPADAAAAAQLALLLHGLGQCVSYVHERKHEALVSTALDLPLWGLPPAARAALLDLITHLVVANGALVQSCLQTLVYGLLPPPGPPQPDARAGQAWQPEPAQAAVQDEVLAAATRVLALVPTSAGRLLPLLLGNMPHKLRDRGTHCLYLRGLFALAESGPGAAIREGLLAGVLDHLTGVDVEIRWEDIAGNVAEEEAREEEGGLPPEDEPDIFELEGMTDLELNCLPEEEEGDGRGGGPGAAMRGGWEGGAPRSAAAADSSAGAAAGAEAAAGGPPVVNEVADKLDSMMELTFAHLERRLAAGQHAAAWSTLLAAFERSVLHTHRSKFVQFVLFYAAKAAPEAAPAALLDLLIARLTDRHQPPITRAACAAYAASFLARAAYVPESEVVDALRRVADWALKYARDEERRGGLAPIPSAGSLGGMMLSGDAHVRHAAFYAAVQALLYVLCYHAEPLLRPHHHHPRPGSKGGAGAKAAPAAQQQGQQGQQGQQQANGSLGSAGCGAPAGGTPASADTGGSLRPGSLRARSRVEQQQHAAARHACAAAVRVLLCEALPPLLASRLDPLASCARSVVAEFGRQARLLGFADLARQIKEWRRAATASGARASRPLEVFFPFDPYLLSRSAAYLDLPSTFVRWRRGHPAGAARADLESDGSGEEEGEDEDEEEVDSGSEGEEQLDPGADVAAGADGGMKLSARTGDASASSSGLSSSSSDGGSSGDDSDSEGSSSEGDDLKRSRFGSMPGSSFGSDARPSKRRMAGLPLALQASLMHGSGSPTHGFVVGSGSPFGTSPYGTGAGSGPGSSPLFGAAAAPPLPPAMPTGRSGLGAAK